VHGLALLKKQGSQRLIYTDSRIAMGWVRKGKCGTKLKKGPKNAGLFELIARAEAWLANNTYTTPIVKWETKAWGEIPADYGRKRSKTTIAVLCPTWNVESVYLHQN